MRRNQACHTSHPDPSVKKDKPSAEKEDGITPLSFVEALDKDRGDLGSALPESWSGEQRFWEAIVDYYKS